MEEFVWISDDRLAVGRLDPEALDTLIEGAAGDPQFLRSQGDTPAHQAQDPADVKSLDLLEPHRPTRQRGRVL